MTSAGRSPLAPIHNNNLPRPPAPPPARPATTPSPPRQLTNHLVEFIALVLLPLAVLMVAYALLVFVWRNSQIALRQASYIDDRRGPLLLCGAVVAALGAIFLVSALDFLEAMHHAHPVGLGCCGPSLLLLAALPFAPFNNVGSGLQRGGLPRRGRRSRPAHAVLLPPVQGPADGPAPAPGGMLLQAGSAALPGMHSSF